MKRIWKRAVSILSATILTVMFVLSAGTVSFAEEGEVSDATGEEPLEAGTSYNVGDIIKFGHYEQDGNTTNGKEEIEWQVLKVESDRVLVVSKYALDCKKYNETYTDSTWENCTLRNWLNNDFKNAAFTSAEQAKIPTVTVVNENNPKHGTEGGNNTNDQLFCLSIGEIESYFGSYSEYNSEDMYGGNQNLICDATQYDINNGVSVYTITECYDNSYLKGRGYTSDVIGRRGVNWWLRSVGGLSSWITCYVSRIGSAGAGLGRDVTVGDYAVRPALYINTSGSSDASGIFADIKADTWQYKAAKSVYDKGYMTGTGEVDGKIVFSPNTNINRSQFVVALYSMDGKPETEYEQKFFDVKSSAWYAKQVTWASNNGIVAGNPDGTFGVNGKATREQLALMFYKYAMYKNYDVSVSPSTTLDSFTDAGKVDSWAVTAVKWAVERGIISGKGNAKDGYRIDPIKGATRIECAAMMNKFDSVYSDVKLVLEAEEEPLALPMEEIEDVPIPEEEMEDIVDEEDSEEEDSEEEITDEEEPSEMEPEDEEDIKFEE